MAEVGEVLAGVGAGVVGAGVVATGVVVVGAGDGRAVVGAGVVTTGAVVVGAMEVRAGVGAGVVVVGAAVVGAGEVRAGVGAGACVTGAVVVRAGVGAGVLEVTAGVGAGAPGRFQTHPHAPVGSTWQLAHVGAVHLPVALLYDGRFGRQASTATSPACGQRSPPLRATEPEQSGPLIQYVASPTTETFWQPGACAEAEATARAATVARMAEIFIVWVVEVRTGLEEGGRSLSCRRQV